MLSTPVNHGRSTAAVGDRSGPGTRHLAGAVITVLRVRGTLAEAAIPAGPAEPDRLAPFDRRVLVVAATVFVVLMALSGLYGFHRDELYFLDCARHLQGGYVDQPILTPLLARLSLSLLGVWLPGLRFWAALSAAATVVTGGLLARELGGGRHAQLVAAVATATMPAVLGGGHLMGPTTFDILAWAALSLVVVRIGRTENPRLWVLAGLILGLGLANKHSVGFFAVAVFAGALLSGGWRLGAQPLVPGRCRSLPPVSPFLTSGGRQPMAGQPIAMTQEP